MTRDPDLAAALADFPQVVADIRRYDAQILSAPRDGRKHREVHSLEMIRTDQIGKIKVRAERLKLPWRSLKLIVEKHAQLAKRMRRKPDERTLLIAVEAEADDAQASAEEAEADLLRAEVAAELARARVTTAAAAVSYMRASHAPA